MEARRLDPWADRAEVKRIWVELERACRPTYFLSWGWIETWLATLPRYLRLSLVSLEDARGPLAAWFVGRRLRLQGGILPTRTLYLNETGWPAFDELTIEHNRWLARAPITLDTVLAHMPRGWDEVVMSTMDEIEVPANAIRRDVACHVVDLAKVRASGDYVGLLGSSTRAQIRRAHKLYAQRGELAIEVASTIDSARDVFDELVRLHAIAWHRRGASGAFSRYLERFHGKLIADRFARGEIQLARVRAGDSTLGCLYNFVHDGVVSYYQSGFTYEADNKLKPGLVCHALAIAHNARAGHAVYDLLGSDAGYKRSLATDTRKLTSVTIRRPRLRFAIAGWLRRLTRRASASS